MSKRIHKVGKNTPTKLPLEFYKVIVENMTEGLWVGDKNDQTRYVNPTFEKIFGYGKSEWQGKHSYTYFDSKNAAIIKEENKKRPSGQTSRYEVEVLSRGGAPIPVLMSGAPLPDGGTIGIMADLRKLKETEERYRSLVENMNEGVWVGDAQGRTVYANPAFLELLGYKLGEILGEKDQMFVAPEYQQILKEETKKRSRNMNSHYETLLLTKAGEKIPVLIHAVPFNYGSVATITDLRMLKKLEKRQQEFESFARFSMDAMVTLDENDIVHGWNVGAERMFGLSEKEMLGQSISRIVPQEKRDAGEIEHLFKEVREKGFVRNYETTRLHKNGTPIQIALTYNAVHDPRGKGLGYIAVYRDITMQKSWESELQKRFDRMQDAYMEMGKLRRYVDYLVDLMDLVHNKVPNTNIPHFIANAILMFTKADTVILRLLDASEKKLILAGRAGSINEWNSKNAVVFKGSLAEKAFAMEKSLKVLDVTQDPLYKTPGLARKNNVRSMLLLPLMVPGKKIGTVSVYVGGENRLDVLDHEFIPIFVNQAALVLLQCFQK